jgi:ribonucleoside-diphosphate reductase alpha chain
MTQTTSGIEPVFLRYINDAKSKSKRLQCKRGIVDEVGDTWEEYNVFHHKFVTWLETNGYDPEEVKNYDDTRLNAIVEKSPYIKLPLTMSTGLVRLKCRAKSRNGSTIP